MLRNLVDRSCRAVELVSRLYRLVLPIGAVGAAVHKSKTDPDGGVIRNFPSVPNGLALSFGSRGSRMSSVSCYDRKSGATEQIKVVSQRGRVEDCCVLRVRYGSWSCDGRCLGWMEVSIRALVRYLVTEEGGGRGRVSVRSGVTASAISLGMFFVLSPGGDRSLNTEVYPATCRLPTKTNIPYQFCR